MPFTQSEADFILIPDRNQAIQDWRDTKRELSRLQELERAKRAVLYKALFPGNVDSTETLDLGGGFLFKATGSLNYKLMYSTKEGGDEPLQNALDKIEKTGNEGAFIADRLVKWEPKLSVGEYKKLASDSPIKAIIDGVLTITPGSPTLEFVEPKTK